VNHKRIARLMRKADIEGRHQRKRRCLTKQDKTAAPAPDLLGRDFHADAPNAKWVATSPTSRSETPDSSTWRR
jgi:transposase InsO family protein